MKLIRKIGVVAALFVCTSFLASSCSGCGGSKCNECPSFSNIAQPNTLPVAMADEAL